MNAVKKRPVFRGFVTFSISKPGLKLMTLGVNSSTPFCFGELKKYLDFGFLPCYDEFVKRVAVLLPPLDD